MHIAEGIVTGLPAAASAGIGIALMAAGAKKMQAFARELPQHKPLLGMAGAFIFLLSLIPIPVLDGRTCSHPCGSPLAGILLGPWIGIALSGLSLLLQAAFFSHGGFSTWGVNVLALGVGGAGFGWLGFKLARGLGVPFWLAAGFGGLLGDLMTYVISGLVLGGALVHAPQPRYGFTGYLVAIYGAYLPTVLPIALGEMILSGLAVRYILDRRPEVLAALRMTPRPAAGVQATLILLAILGIFTLCASRVAATPPPAPAPLETRQQFTGMDESVNERLAEEAGRPSRAPFIDTERMGDLWNTLLLLAGGVCGFILGRGWDSLFGKARKAAVTAAPMEET